MTSTQQRAALQRQIWQIANDVRGAVDGWDFKQYVLGTLFYRFISENFASYIEGGDDSNYDKFNIQLGNTLEEPHFADDRPFDAIVSNPPYSVKWIGSDDPTLINDERFAPAGVLAPKSKADFAFVLHALNYLSASPLFYNVLFNELNGKVCYMLERFEDGTFALTEKHGDSNKSFSYHLHLKQTIEQAIAENKVEKYHFTLLRNLYEKTASFLGYPKWSDLLPDDRQLYLSRIINFTSHSSLSNETVAEPTPAEKATVKLLLDHLKSNYGFWSQVGNQ